MYRIVNEKPSNLSIEIVDCIDRGGHNYTHPFIGGYALSRAMLEVLRTLGVNIFNGSRVPDSLFDDYTLMECEYHPDNPDDEKFVTSNYWYTCKKKWPEDELCPE